MKLKITTDYAIRTLLYLAETGRVTTSVEISEAMNIPHNYLINIIRNMREGDLITTLSGAKGGCILARPSNEIRLYDVIKAMERTIQCTMREPKRSAPPNPNAPSQCQGAALPESGFLARPSCSLRRWWQPSAFGSSASSAFPGIRRPRSAAMWAAASSRARRA